MTSRNSVTGCQAARTLAERPNASTSLRIQVARLLFYAQRIVEVDRRPVGGRVSSRPLPDSQAGGRLPVGHAEVNARAGLMTLNYLFLS
jgi:hypothetical protein